MNWDYFDKFEPITDKYLPAEGEGENTATQIVTAVTKLVYKWYNDGDVYDNTHGMTGWCNDLSSYANWLHMHTSVGGILERIFEIGSDYDAYEAILADIADALLKEEYLDRMANIVSFGSIYDCDGPFRFEEYEDDDEDDEDEDW